MASSFRDRFVDAGSLMQRLKTEMTFL